MSIFTEAPLDYRRLDVNALVSHSGMGCVWASELPQWQEWLRSEGYVRESLDCSAALADIIGQIDTMFRWQEQFGYTLSGLQYNLDALRDGFDFPLMPQGGRVLEYLAPERLYEREPRLLLGLLAITAEHSRVHLAQGSRFFGLLAIDHGSQIVGAAYEGLAVPHPQRFSDVQPEREV